jgi:hypothetical protein
LLICKRGLALCSQPAARMGCVLQLLAGQHDETANMVI